MASAYPIVRFVTEPAAAPVTVLDLNTTDGHYVADDNFETFTLGAPDGQFEPEMVGGDEGYRTAEFTYCILESYTNSAQRISALSKVLQRDSGWLMVQREATHKPFFLQWYKTGFEPVSWERGHNNTFTLPVRLQCDPGVYGEPVVLSTQSIVNNPAAVSGNKAEYVLPAVKGDMPTPLKVDITPTGTPPAADWTGYQPFMAVSAYNSDQLWSGPILWDLLAAQWTAGADTGGNNTSGAAGLIGGSRRDCTFATQAGMATRLSGGPTVAPTPGTYKVLMRAAVSVDNSTLAVRLGQKFNLTQTYWGETRTIVRPDNLTEQEFWTWVDLGEFTFPFGASGLDATDIGAAALPELEIQAQRISGVAGLLMDAIRLVPIDTVATGFDTYTQTSRFHGFGLETDRNGIWDGQKQRFNAYNFGTTLANLRQPKIDGGWLRVVPGANNVLHLIQQTLIDTPFFTDIADSDSIAKTCDVKLSYLPRYLHFRPDSE